MGVLYQARLGRLLSSVFPMQSLCGECTVANLHQSKEYFDLYCLCDMKLGRVCMNCINVAVSIFAVCFSVLV